MGPELIIVVNGRTRRHLDRLAQRWAAHYPNVRALFVSDVEAIYRPNPIGGPPEVVDPVPILEGAAVYDYLATL